MWTIMYVFITIALEYVSWSNGALKLLTHNKNYREYFLPIF